jgi:hypothetical protein
MTLEEVLADWRGDAAVARRLGHLQQAEQLERMADQVAAAAEDYLTFLNEPDARLVSGKTLEWLRGRFPEWLDRGLARYNGKKREYRQLALPRRANVPAARAAGRRAAQERSA